MFLFSRTFLFVSCIFLFSTTVMAQLVSIDKTIVIVDEGVILKSELEQRLSSIKSRFSENASQLPPEEILRKQIIEHLIVENLQLQMASRMGVVVDQNTINQAIARMAAQQGMGAQQFINQLKANGENIQSLIRSINKEITIQEVQRAQVQRRIYVSDADVENFLQSAEGAFWQKPSLDLRHIQLNLTSSASPEETASQRVLSQQIFNELVEGADFETMAVKHSKSSSALDGGKIGWKRSVEFPVEISEVLETAKVGTITAPIRSSGGLHIFQVLGVKGGEQPALIEQNKTRHILIIPNEIRDNEESKTLVLEIKKRIENGESFEALAKEYSEDISNSLKGGELGWVLPGQMVPEFEKQIQSTPIGKVSEPVQTQFGWHILRIDERKSVDMSVDIRRNQARGVIGNQRYPEELDLWLRELRNDAFVSILDNG